MLTPAWGWSNSGVASARSCPRDWGEARSRCRRDSPDSAPVQRRCSVRRPRPIAATSCALRQPRPAAGSARTRPTKLFGKLDDGADPRDAEARSGGSSGRRAVEAPRAARRTPGTSASRPCPADWSDLLLRARARLERPPRTAPRCWLRAAQPRPRSRPQRLPLPRRAHVRLRGVAADDRAAASRGSTRRGSRRASTILRVLSDTHNVATQGPVWRVDGKGCLAGDGRSCRLAADRARLEGRRRARREGRAR